MKSILPTTKIVFTVSLCLTLALIAGCGKNVVESNLELAGKAVSAHDKATAAKYVAKAIASNPQDPEVHMKVVIVYTRPGFHDEQVKAAKDLVAILDSLGGGSNAKNRKYLEIYSTIAMLMDKGNEDTLAEHCYEETVRLEPNDPMLSNNLAYFYAEHRKNLVQAEKLARYAVGMRPGEPSIEDTMGWVLFQLGRFSEAEGHLRRSVEGTPDNPDLRYHLAAVYAAQGKNEQAKIELHKCLKLSPNYPVSQLTLNKPNK
jgi:Flp pilus assembly protein TadD